MNEDNVVAINKATDDVLEFDISKAFEAAEKEVKANTFKDAVSKFKRKLQDLENAKKIVKNIEFEIEVLKRDLAS